MIICRQQPFLLLWVKLLLESGTNLLVYCLWTWRDILEHANIAWVLIVHKIGIWIFKLIHHWNDRCLVNIKGRNLLMILHLTMWSIDSSWPFWIHYWVLDVRVHRTCRIDYVSRINCWNRLIEIPSEYSSFTLRFKQPKKLCQHRFFSFNTFLLLLNLLQDTICWTWSLIVRNQAKCLINDLLLMSPCV